ESNRKKIVLAEPEVFNETPSICDQLKNGYTVVINFEKIKSDEIKKTFYFLSGVVYTLNGSIQKIAKNVFVLAPNNIDIISDNEDDLYSKDIINWEFDD
ncbi:MAG: cell division protein SepF, partial [Eubacteriaceae bacterium]